MPTYDYLCAACGHALELFQSITERPKRKCPRCKKNRLERQIGSGAGLIFRGSGFYQTDYRSESYKAGEKAETSASSKEPAKSDDQPSTPAPAVESKPKERIKPKPKSKPD